MSAAAGPQPRAGSGSGQQSERNVVTKKNGARTGWGLLGITHLSTTKASCKGLQEKMAIISCCLSNLMQVLLLVNSNYDPQMEEILENIVPNVAKEQLY
jgi:hypothetical protein